MYWSLAKDPFLERYASARPPLSKFKADTARYDEVANNVQKEETLLPIAFLLLDSSPLKHSIVEHCTEWRNKFTDLLFEMAKSDLQSLTDYLDATAVELQKVPETLEMMIEKMVLMQATEKTFTATEHRFGPINDQFAILGKYEIAIPDDI